MIFRNSKILDRVKRIKFEHVIPIFFSTLFLKHNETDLSLRKMLLNNSDKTKITLRICFRTVLHDRRFWIYF